MARPTIGPQAKSKAQINKEYAASRKEKGLTQIKIWVPVPVVPWFHVIANEMRVLDAAGLDPLTKLPTSILPTLKEIRGE